MTDTPSSATITEPTTASSKRSRSPSVTGGSTQTSAAVPGLDGTGPGADGRSSAKRVKSGAPSESGDSHVNVSNEADANTEDEAGPITPSVTNERITSSTAGIGEENKGKMDDVNMEAAAQAQGADGEAGPSSNSTNNDNTASSELPSPADLPSSVPAAPVKSGEAPLQQISMRCLIVTQDASIIIGRAGAHVNEIREKSNARVNVSESIPGNPERILTVSGSLDAVAKAFGLIVRRINDEPFDVASMPGSRAVTIKFIIPNSRMGSVIGKGGSKIKEIQEASGARLNASETVLPQSTERVLSISGVADAVHIAVYYVGTILLEYQERNPGSVSGSYRQTGAIGGGGGGGGRGPSMGGGMGGAPGGLGPQPGPGAQTQQIFIPNSMVGAIIGKGGQKINEIRAQSQCQIRVTDPGTAPSPGVAPNPDERLVTITGQPQHINMAVNLLYARLEAEKQKLASGGAY